MNTTVLDQMMDPDKRIGYLHRTKSRLTLLIHGVAILDHLAINSNTVVPFRVFTLMFQVNHRMASIGVLYIKFHNAKIRNVRQVFLKNTVRCLKCVYWTK